MKLLAFPQLDENIPRPFNYKEGDKYCHLSFEECGSPPLGLPPEAKYIIKEGLSCHGIIHAMYSPVGAYLARLYLDEPGWVIVESYNPSFRSGRYPPSEVDIIGAVEEFWPLGWNGPRVVVNPVDRSEVAAQPLIAVTS